MSDGWYYAGEGHAVGPVTLTELRATLGRLPTSTDVLVWRDGFQDWKKATDVPELTPRKPPPLPTTSANPQSNNNWDTGQQIASQNRFELKECLEHVEHAPIIGRVGGTGFTLLGRFSDPDKLVGFSDSDPKPTYFSVYAFTFLWILLFPIRIYVVTGPSPRDSERIYRFHATISWSNFSRVYPGQTLKLLGSALLRSLLAPIALLLAVASVRYLRRHG